MSQGQRPSRKRAAARRPKKTAGPRSSPPSQHEPQEGTRVETPGPPAAASGAQRHDGESRATAFPIVGIGASAGGLASFESLFAAMPSDDASGIAFVLVQHLAPDHKSVLVDLVKRYTKMQVFEAENGMPVLPNSTYIIPPNHDLKLIGGALYLERHQDRHKPQLTIDHFF